MKELKLNCTLYFVIPDGVTPEQYVKHLQNLSTWEMTDKATDLGTCYDWEYSDEESGSFNWVPL